MANKQAKINIGVGFTIDKTGLQQMESALQSVYLKADSMANTGQKMSDGLRVAGQTAKDLERILQSAYNPKLGTMNITKFNQSLKETGYTAASLKQNLSYDTNGAYAFNQLSRSVLNTNTQLIQSNKLLDKMGQTLGNTIRWSITSSLINTITSSIQKAYTYTKQLDTSLNNIRIVTGKSAEEMNEFAENANKAAKALGSSTLDYTKASLIYYQQGLSDQEVKARAETTVKVSNITKQTGDAVSEELTAVWNGYKVSAQETEKYIDKLAAVAATTASDLEELSTGMSKVASAANAMGVDFDDLNAQIATIVSVTRQAPESVGTALKTIYARMGDLKVDGVDEFGVKLGEVTSQLQTMGIEILDQNGNMRDMSSVMAEVAEKWDTWTRAQQQAAAIAMAGKRQYNNLVALFENWDMYSDALETSKDSLGTLQKQQDIYMESTEAKLKTLKATWEGLYKNLFNQKDIKSSIDGLINVIDLSDKVIKNFGGGIKTLSAFGVILTSIFSQQLGQSINGFLQQQNAVKYNLELLNTQKEYLNVGSASSTNDAYSTISEKEKKATNAALDEQIEKTNQIFSVRSGLSKEEAEILMNLQKQAGELQHNITYAKEQASAILESNKAIEKTTVLLGEENLTIKEAIDQEWGLDRIFENIYEEQNSREENLKNLKQDRFSLEKQITNELDKQINKINEKLPKLEEAAKLEEEKSLVRQQQITTSFDKNINILQGYQSKDLRQNTKEGKGVKAEFDSISKDLRQSLSKEGQIKFDSIPSSSKSFAEILQKIINLLKEEKELQLENENINNNKAKKALDNANKEKASLEELKKERQEELSENQEKITILQQEIKDTNNLISSSQKYAEVIKAQKENQKELNALNLEFNQRIQSAKSGANIVNTVTGLSSALGSLAMSLNSVNTLFDVWDDKEKTVGQKFTQTLMTLGITIPMVISTLNKLNASLGFNTTLQEANEAIITRKIAKQKIQQALAIQEKINATDALKVEATSLVLKAADLGITEDMTEADFKQMLVDKEQLVLDDAEVSKLYSLVMAKLLAKKGTDALTESNKKLSASMLASPWAIVIAFLAVAAASTALLIKAQKKAQQASIDANKEKIKEIKENQEIIKTNEELYNSYENLYLEFLKTGEETTELKNAALELANAYDIVGGRVLALTGNFEDLNKEVTAQRIKALEKASEEAAEASEKAINNLASQGGQRWFEVMGEALTETFSPSSLLTSKTGNKYGASYLYQGQQLLTGEEKDELMSILSSLNIHGRFDRQSYRVDRELIDLTDTEQFAKYIKDTEDAIIAINQYQEEGATKSKNVAKFLSYYQAEMQKELDRFDEEDLTTLKEEYKLQVEYGLRNQLADNLNKIDNKTIKNIYDEVSKIKEIYKDAFSDTEFNSILSEELDYLGLDENLKVTIEFLLELEKDNKISDDIKSVVSKLNAQQIAFLQLHIDTKATEEDLKAWLNDPNTQKLLNYEGLVGQAYSQKTLLLTGTDKGFKQEDLDTFFQDETNLSMSQEDFTNLDIGNQISQVAYEYINNIKEIEKSHEELEESFTKLYTEAEEKLKDFRKNHESTYDEINNILNKSPMLDGRLEELLEALATEDKDLTQEQRILLEQFQTLGGATQDQIKTYSDMAKEENKLSNAVKAYESDLSKLNNTESEYLKVIEELYNAQKANNSIIDEAQTAYNSLNSMVEDYNKNHRWTLDNVQALMTMSNKYVAQLEFENGQLSLNEEGFKKLTIAKLKDELATAELQYQTEVNRLATIATADANDYASQKAALYAAQLETLGMVAEGTSKEMWDLAEAIAAIDSKGSPEVQAAYKQSKQAYENRKKAIEESIKQIESSGTGFKDMMSSGSKSGDSKSKDKDEKKFEDEFDRYWEYKKAIDMLDKSLSRLEKIQSKLHGKELIKSLKEENQLLEKQKANYEALLQAQERHAGELQGQLATYGAIFNDNGELANYADLTSNMLAQYTSAIQQYNAGMLNDEGLEIYEKQYEDFKEALEKYDNLYYSEMQDTLDKLDDARRKQLENNLKAWETEIQIKLDLTQAERDWNAFIRDVEQDFRKIYKDLIIESVYDTKDFNTYVTDLNTTLQTIHDVENEIDKLMAGGVSDMFESVSDAQEKLKDLEGEMLEQGKELYSLYQSVWDNYIDKLDQAADNLKDINDEFDHISDELEYQKKLIELIYGDKAYVKMDKFYTAQQKNINMQISSLKTQKDFWEQQFNAAYEMNKKNHNVILNDMSTWTEDMRKAYDEMIDSQEKLNNMIIEGINNLTDKYLNKLAEALDNLDKSIWGMSLDDLKNDWDKITDLADEYLEDQEKAAEVQLLINKVNNSIDNTKDLKLQQKLADFRDNEVQALMAKENLSENDLKIMEARYDIMLKEAALEDAQNAKNSMKLTRNSSGNWTYQYVADDDDVSNKKSDLLQSYLELYRLADDSYAHSIERVMSLQEKMREEMKNAGELYKDDPEKLNEAIENIKKYYFEQMEIAVQKSEDYKQEAIAATGMIFTEVCEQNETTYGELTDEQQRLVTAVKEGHLEDYEEIRKAIVDDTYPEIRDTADEVFKDTNIHSQSAAAQVIEEWAGDDGESVKNKINKAIDDIEKNTQDFEIELDNMKDTADIDFTDVDTMIDITSSKIEDMEDKTEQMTSNSSINLEFMRQAVENLEVQFQAVIDRINEAIGEMVSYKEAVGAAEQAMRQLNIQMQVYNQLAGKGASGGNIGDTGVAQTGPKTVFNGKYKWQSDPNGVNDTMGLIDSDGKYVAITDDINLFVKDMVNASKAGNVSFADIYNGKKTIIANKFGVGVDQIDFSELDKIVSAAVSSFDSTVYNTRKNTNNNSNNNSGYKELKESSAGSPLSTLINSREEAMKAYNDAVEGGYLGKELLMSTLKNAGVWDAMTGVAEFTSKTASTISKILKDLWQTNKDYYSLATGGYTGEWDTSGRLAILHQKELVLNQDDTSNFLKATSLLRDISKINGNVEDSIMTSILNMMGALAPKVSGFSMDNKSSEVGGNVFNITAEFPNANDVSSIKEAILSLPNIASQYVHQRS